MSPRPPRNPRKDPIMQIHKPTPEVLAAIEAGTFVGLVDGLAPDAYYGAHKYYSNSFLSEVKRSPYHAKMRRGEGGEPMEKTPALLMGERVHMAVLEPERFAREFAVAPRIEDHPGALQTFDDLKEKCRELGLKVGGTRWDLMARLRDAAKERCLDIVLWDDILDQVGGGKTLIDPETMAEITGMRDAVLRHKTASAIFAVPGYNEISAFAKHPRTGLMLRSRYDRLVFNEGAGLLMIADLKTSADAAFEPFQRSIYKFGYHRQSPFYLDVLKLATGAETTHFPHAVVEKTRPYAVAVYELDDASLEKGRQEYEGLLDIVANCELIGEWPSYPDDIVPISLPHWAWND